MIIEAETQDYSKIMMIDKNSDMPIDMNDNINIQFPPNILNSSNYQHLTSRI